MKRSKLIGLALLLFLPIVTVVGIANAQSFRSGENTTVTTSEIIDGSLWTAGRNIDIAGEVKGDVFCAGQNVTISGKIHGDIICAAQTIRVSGTVDGDVRSAAQTVAVSSEIKSNLTVASQTFTLEGTGNVGGDSAIAAEDANLNGKIGRDLAVTSTQATIAGEVGRNVKATIENLTVNSQAKVGGELTYTSDNEANITPGAQLAKKAFRYEPERESKANYGEVYAFSFGFAVYLAISLLVLSLALVLLFPRFFHETSGRAISSPGKTLLTGLGASIVVPIVIVALMLTVIGIPLGLLLLLTWLLVLALSGPLASYYFGRLLLQGQQNPVVIMLAGALTVLLVYFIPIIGLLLMIAVVWIGAGMLLLELYGRTPKPNYTIKE